MDLITTGRSAADRGRIEQLSACRRRRCLSRTPHRRRYSFAFPQPAAAAAAAPPCPANDAGANAPAGTELSGLLADRRRDAFSANEIGAELRERMNMDVSADDVRPLSSRAPCQPAPIVHPRRGRVLTGRGFCFPQVRAAINSLVLEGVVGETGGGGYRKRRN